MVLFRAAKFFSVRLIRRTNTCFSVQPFYFIAADGKSQQLTTLYSFFRRKNIEKIICNTLFFNAGDISHINYFIPASISSVAKAFRSSPAVLPAENS